MSERKRSANWLLAEKLLLLDLVTEHFGIIENKKTDGVSVKQKNAEWVLISNEFNSQTVNNHRTGENLKSQWESQKKSAKKVASSARQSLMLTGGGPAKLKDNDPIHDRVLGLISTSAVGLINKFDSDSIIISQAESKYAQVSVPDVSDLDVPSCTVTSHPVSYITLQSQDDNAMKMISKDWGDYTPKMLQSPISTSLRFDQKDVTACPVSDDGDISKPIGKTPTLKAKQWSSSKRRPTLQVSEIPEDLHKKKIRAVEMQMLCQRGKRGS